LSQLKLFVENERPKDPPNVSITTHAVAAVDGNFDASYEVQTFNNRNNDVIDGEQKKGLEGSIILPYAQLTTTIKSPRTSSKNLFDVNVANVASPSVASLSRQQQQQRNKDVNDSPRKAFEPIGEVSGKKWFDMPYESLQPLSKGFVAFVGIVSLERNRDLVYSDPDYLVVVV
jgi:hypothetical protein